MKLSGTKTFDESLAEDLQDPEFRAEWERTAAARTVANEIVKYRVEHHLTQTRLGLMLNMHQSAIARLELGEHEPSIATLIRLSRGLGINFHLVITPESLSFSA